jgi:hypothetical protein
LAGQLVGSLRRVHPDLGGEAGVLRDDAAGEFDLVALSNHGRIRRYR